MFREARVLDTFCKGSVRCQIPTSLVHPQVLPTHLITVLLVGTLRVTAKGIKTSGCSRAWGLNALTEECTHLKIEGQPDVALNPEPQT